MKNIPLVFFYNPTKKARHFRNSKKTLIRKPSGKRKLRATLVTIKNFRATLGTVKKVKKACVEGRRVD